MKKNLPSNLLTILLGVCLLSGCTKDNSPESLNDGIFSIDLGLSVNWANCNIGAYKPEDCGNYYQWAGTEDVSPRIYYLDWSYCPYHAGTSSSSGFTKYNSNPSYGTVDNKTVLGPGDVTSDEVKMTG